MKNILPAFALLGAMLAPFAQAQPAPSGAAVAPDDLPAATLMGGGPYKAIMESDPGLPTHTIYRPADLAAPAATRLPIVVWGNGACANVGNRFRWFLSEIASYGYLVVAVGPIGPGSVATAPASYAPAPPISAANPAPAPPTGAPDSRSAQLIDAMNWAVAENGRPGSKYFHRLDPAKIAVMGQSCGGVQAIEASADPRVTTTMVWNSGLLPGVTTMAGGKPLTKSDLRLLHAPAAYISGDDEDIAYANANDDFDRLQGIAVFRGYARGVLHGGTYRDRNGGEFGAIAVAWLNWRLKGDRRSALMFQGPDCGLCVNPRWVVRKKGMN